MELGRQIKKCRNEMNLSQDELAEKAFVSRQTISNWENDKSYPNVESLALLSAIFNVSIDNLIKGDIKEMKREINENDFQKYQKDSGLFTILLFAAMILPVPMAYFAGVAGLAIWGVLAIITIVYSLRIENYKKKYDIQTFKEILAFNEGKDLNEIERAREDGKRPYQKVFIVACFTAIAMGVSIFFCFIIKIFG